MLNTEPRKGAKPVALVVDDEPSICATLCSILEDESFSACRAFDGEEALEKLKEFSPDIVFLDIWMPGWDGIETLEQIKRLSPETEVIMISGHATIANALEATKRGAFDFIEKPLDLESVILSATRALERRQQSQSISGRSQVSTPDGLTHNPEDIPPLLKHNGVLSQGLKGRDLGQRTLARGAILYGSCLHSGQKSGLVLEPLPPDTGIHFAKIGDAKPVPAYVDYVNSTSFATTISDSGQGSVSTIEHLLSTLHAYKITNLLIKCNDEVPIFDGSAAEFCRVIEEVGIEEQPGTWHEIAIDRPIMVTGQHANDEPDEVEMIILEPSDTPGLTVAYELDYPAPVGRQHFEFTLDDPAEFKKEIAPARTFGFMKDIERLQKVGLAAGGRLDNFILIGPDKIVNTELRFAEELARHKILDAIGDLFLLGRPLSGKVRAQMTGHSDNIRLISELKELI